MTLTFMGGRNPGGLKKDPGWVLEARERPVQTVPGSLLATRGKQHVPADRARDSNMNARSLLRNASLVTALAALGAGLLAPSVAASHGTPVVTISAPRAGFAYVNGISYGAYTTDPDAPAVIYGTLVKVLKWDCHNSRARTADVLVQLFDEDGDFRQGLNYRGMEPRGAWSEPNIRPPEAGRFTLHVEVWCHPGNPYRTPIIGSAEADRELQVYR